MERIRLVARFMVAAAILAGAACTHEPRPAVGPSVGVSTVTRAAIALPPLSSWVDGPTKQSILDFVNRVATPGNASMLREEDRIAVFTDDGTLWPEVPLAEAVFVVARLRAEIAEKPSLAEHDPYRRIFRGGLEGLESLGPTNVLTAVARTHAGMSDDAFDSEARVFFANAVQPRFNLPFHAVVYRPMRELLEHLREHGFTIYVTSVADEGFVRAASPRAFSVPPERVIGSSVEREVVVENGRTVLRRKAEMSSYNDGDEKVANLQRRIGRRPILAVGRIRSGGDVPMLSWVTSGTGPSLGVVVSHDDPQREVSYAETDGETLSAARRRGFTLVSMKNDWTTVFEPRPPPPPPLASMAR